MKVAQVPKPGGEFQIVDREMPEPGTGHVRIKVQACAAGSPADSEDTLRFAELTGVRPMIERYPLEKAAEAYARMLSGKAEFRVVLTM
jgi:D-arabinose 1-dehydrogenase-like Zn-dependent alcohol dehydrogenase